MLLRRRRFGGACWTVRVAPVRYGIQEGFCQPVAHEAPRPRGDGVMQLYIRDPDGYVIEFFAWQK